MVRSVVFVLLKAKNDPATLSNEKEVESCGLGIQAPLALLFGPWLVLGCIPLNQDPGDSESGVFSRLWGSPYGFLSPRGDAQIGTAYIHSDWSIFPRPAK